MSTDLVIFAAQYTAERLILDPLVSRAVERGRKVLDIAITKARGRTDGRNERTILKALNEAVTVDDSVTADYLGGIIASSDATDDAVPVLAQVGRMSALQLRLHYVIYRQLWLRESTGPTMTDLRSPSEMADSSEVYLQLDDLEIALDLEPGGVGVRSLLAALHVLAREDLIGPHIARDTSYDGVGVVGYAIEAPWKLEKLRGRTFPAVGLICSPTPSGVELFLRGCGLSEYDPTFIRSLSSELVQALVPDIRGALVADLPG